jgi:hypothetical protein
MEGIFRVSGFHESITKLRQFFNQGTRIPAIARPRRVPRRSSPFFLHDDCRCCNS